MRKLILVVIILIGKIGFSQESWFDNPVNFCELIKNNKLENVKAGLFVTAIRNDTLFSLQYFIVDNSLLIIPIANLEKLNQRMNIAGGLDHFENEGLMVSMVEDTIENNGILSYIINQELICDVFKTLDSLEEKLIIKKIKREIHYSKTKGVYQVNYAQLPNDLNCDHYDWLYKEGDFYNFIMIEKQPARARL